MSFRRNNSAAWSRVLPLALLLAMACALAALQPLAADSPGASSLNQRPCDRLPLFDRYLRAGALSRPSRLQLILDLPINLHSADCGAADGYGHTMRVALELREQGGACRLRAATSRNESFGEETFASTLPAFWVNKFKIVGRPDLASPELSSLELRDFKNRQALLLFPDGFYFYENVAPDSELIRGLDPGEDERCCYGYSSTMVAYGLNADQSSP